jgi:hypothetical protein
VLKKPVISIFVLLAFVMFQVHNFIPHLHADHDQPAHSHQDYDHHEHESNGANDHDDADTPLDLAAHDAELGKVVIKPQDNISKLTQKNADIAMFVPNFIIFLQPDQDPPPKLPPDQYSTLVSSLFYQAFTLRGPPLELPQA